VALHEIIKIKLSFYHKLHCVKLAAARGFDTLTLSKTNE